ncbi:MAG: hypothetical protein WKF92_04120 [Pyrinomonadaceae bacterium]
MITGFNTDIEFEGVTYHVQTEDKGLSTPIILSLVYNRGTILASKRVPYDDLLAGKFDEGVLAERLQKQHRLFCAAVQVGRIDDLIKMTARTAKEAKKNPSPKPAVAIAGTKGISAFFQSDDCFVGADGGFYDPACPIPMPLFESGTETLHDIMSRPTIEDVTVLEDEIILPDEAVEVFSDLPGTGRSANNKLSIEILGDTKFKGGERRTLAFMVCRGSDRKVVGGAQIMVKIIGSSFRPQIFHASTDSNGLATVTFDLPSFREGRAAFLVRAMSDGEEIELRRSVVHG